MLGPYALFSETKRKEHTVWRFCSAILSVKLLYTEHVAELFTYIRFVPDSNLGYNTDYRHEEFVF